jgi:PAS domain S-box-containing protein
MVNKEHKKSSTRREPAIEGQELLTGLLQQFSRGLQPPEVLDAVQQSLQRLDRWPLVRLVEVDPGSAAASPQSGLAGQALRSGETQLWRRGDAGAAVEAGLADAACALAAPLLFAGQVLGALSLESRRPHDFSPKEVAFIETLADLTALALHNARQAAALRFQTGEHWNAEAARATGQHKLDRLLELLPVGVAILDGQGKVVFENPALERILGLRRGESEGEAFHRRLYLKADGSPMPPQDFASAQAASRGRAVLDVETGVVKEDGQTTWTSVSAVPVDFPDWKTVIVTADITARKQAEMDLALQVLLQSRAAAALRESEQRYSLLFEKMAIPGFLLKLPEVRIVAANQAAEKLTGFCKEEILGKNAAELGLISPEQRSVTISRFDQAKALAQNEMLITTKTGDERIILVNTNPLEINGQTFAITSLLDITERTQAELALANSRENFALLFDANPAALVITRRVDARFMRINAAYTRIIGYHPEEIVGRTASEMNIYADPAQRQEVLRRMAESGSLQGYEVLIRIKSGEVRTLAVSMEAIRFEGEDCLLSALLDLTERKRMEENLRRSNADLEQFAYIASHDLQEPLRTVAGMVELLRDRYQGKLDERADTYITLAVEASQHMHKLINNLLDFSRVSRFGKPFERVPMEAVYQTALQNLGAAIEASHARITHDPLPDVMVDPVQIAQVLQNLLDNAIKFRSQCPLHIHIGAQKIDRAWQITVSDNGIGIQPQHFERIFLIFQHLNSRRLYPGTGIGLAISKKIIERHGGQIWVESVPQQGSTFYFTLPEIP